MNKFGFVFLLVSGTLAFGQKAPLPDRVVKASAVFLINESNSKLGDAVYRELRKWDYWQLVTERSKADLVLVVSQQETVVGAMSMASVSTAGSAGYGIGVSVPVTSQDWYLHVFSAGTGEELWTSSYHLSFAKTWNGIGKKLVADLKDRMQPRSQHSQTTAAQSSMALPDDLFVWFDESAPPPGTKLFEVLLTPRAYDAVVELIRKARQENTNVRSGNNILETGYRPATMNRGAWHKINPASNPSFFYWQDEKPDDTSAVMHLQMTERAYQQAIAISINSGSLRFVPPPPPAQQPATTVH